MREHRRKTPETRRRTAWTASLLSLGLVGPACATVDAAGAPQALFATHAPVDVTLEGPLRKIARSRKSEDRDWHSAELSFVDESGQTVSLDVDLKARGNFRRRECTSPPLRVRFNEDQVEGTLFAGQRRLKLVSPCKRGKRYDQYVVEEYLVYRIFNLIGEISFLVRPLNLRFVDEKGKSRDVFGFLIEDEDRMAARYGREIADWQTASFDMMNREALANYEMFQFLIAGHDWSVIAGPEGDDCCHNTKLLVEPGSQRDVIPVPYDFDFTGIVNTAYALPPESIPIRRVRERYYRGRCMSPEQMAATLEHFRMKRAAIIDLYRGFEPLAPAARDESIAFIERFYTIIDDPKAFERQILKRCREI